MADAHEAAAPPGAVRAILFGSCRLDLVEERLWKDNAPVHLRRKSWQVLRHLAERPGLLVSTQALLRKFWADAFVVPKVVTNVIRELRDALGEQPHAQRIIETVHRRGYRFVAPVRLEAWGNPPAGPPGFAVGARRDGERDPFAECFAGREQELERLGWLWRKAADGFPQLCFVTGEPGIGKTALLGRFAAHLSAGEPHAPAVGWGYCVQQHGPGEPYLPILQAFEQLAAGPQGERLAKLLRRYAPTWVTQLPWLRQQEGGVAPRPEELAFGSPSSMLREAAAAIDALSHEVPIVLILEDLHWSDPASIDFLGFLTRRRTRARWLVLGAYREVEAIVDGHPVASLSREMRQRGIGERIALGILPPEALRTYVDQCFRSHELSEILTPIVESLSARNPLYARIVMQHFIDSGWVRYDDRGWALTVEPRVLVNHSLADVSALIAAQIDHLGPEEERFLTAASVQGVDFSTNLLAITVEESAELTAQVCRRLTERGQFVRRGGRQTGAGSTDTTSYEFLHVLYQRAFYARLPSAAAKHLHRRVAEHAEQAGAEEVTQSAGRIAFHFSLAGEVDRAAQYFELAAFGDMRRFSYREAAAHFRRAIGELAELPGTPERREREARCSLVLASVLMLTKGFGHSEYLQVAERALTLYTKLDHPTDVLHALAAVVNGWAARAEFDRAAAAQARLTEIAAHGPAALRRVAHVYLGTALGSAGRLLESKAHLEEALTLQTRADVLLLLNEATLALAHLSLVLVPLGYLDQASDCLERALAASASDTAMGRAFVVRIAAVVETMRREAGRALTFADGLAELDDQYGLASFTTSTRIVRNWARAVTRPTSQRVVEIRTALAEREAQGDRAETPMYLALLAEILLRRGEPDEAQACVDEALGHLQRSGSHVYEAELLRLRGEALLARRPRTNGPTEARGDEIFEKLSVEGERSFRGALAVAAERGTRLWGLRAAVSLARLLSERRRVAEAREVLAAARAQITEGRESADLRDATSVLAELDGPLSRSTRERPRTGAARLGRRRQR